jgi:hypothetical protein
MNIVEKLKVFFLSPLEIEEVVSTPHLQLIKSKKGILRELLFSKQNGSVIGVYSSDLGEGMFLTTVDDIFRVENDEIIVFRAIDIHGSRLHRTHFSLNEIDTVCPFNAKYADPITCHVEQEPELVY